MRPCLPCVLLLLGSVAACDPAPLRDQLIEPDAPPVDVPRDAAPPDEAAPASLGSGLASWYGGSHQGKRTASGEFFDRRALTAAHPTLPLKSCLSVLNRATGRRVEVRVNDRGPWVAGRILDLSEAAADAIGMRRQGIAEVTLSPCDRPRVLAAALLLP